MADTKFDWIQIQFIRNHLQRFTRVIKPNRLLHLFLQIPFPVKFWFFLFPPCTRFPFPLLFHNTSLSPFYIRHKLYNHIKNITAYPLTRLCRAPYIVPFYIHAITNSQNIFQLSYPRNPDMLSSKLLHCNRLLLFSLYFVP